MSAARPIALALAEAWQRGEHDYVKNTIACALDTTVSREWKDETAKALPEPQRNGFLLYVRG